MNYIEQVNQKRQSQADQRQTAALVSAARANNKPTILLTDSTDLGSHISKLGDKIIDVLEAVKDDKSTKAQIDRINSMTGEFRELVNTVQSAQSYQTEQIIAAVNDLKQTVSKQKPVVVPAPAVSLQEKDVDLNPIVTAINRLEKMLKPKPAAKQQLDLSRFKAHDLTDGPDNNQYIGFMDMNGNWYIMQHDPAENRDRYYFGSESYEQAWDDKYGLDYRVLSEAIRALSA